MRRTRETKNYALIYIDNKKPIKRAYDTASGAYYDHEHLGDKVRVELYDYRNIKLASR